MHALGAEQAGGIGRLAAGGDHPQLSYPGTVAHHSSADRFRQQVGEPLRLFSPRRVCIWGLRRSASTSSTRCPISECFGEAFTSDLPSAGSELVSAIARTGLSLLRKRSEVNRLRKAS